MSDMSPPPQNIGLFGRITQQLLALEKSLKDGLQERSVPSGLFGRIIRNAQRTFRYDKDDLAGSWIKDIERAFSDPCEAFVLSERANIVLYKAVSEKMESSFKNAAEKGARSVFSSQSKSLDQEFKDYWAGLETSFQETLNGLKDSKSAPLFNEREVGKAVSKLREYCQEQFVRGYYQGRDEATLSPENLCQTLVKLIPDRAQG